MFHVSRAGYFDAKVVGNKAEGDVTPHVTPQSRRVLTLIVASDGKAFLEEFVCKDAGLWEPIHSLSNFDKYPSVGVDNVSEIVFVDDFLGKDVQLEAHVFIALYWDIQIEVGEVNAVEKCAGEKNCGVEKEFCCGEISCWRVLVP
jgi:hypothetical protein